MEHVEKVIWGINIDGVYYVIIVVNTVLLLLMMMMMIWYHVITIHYFSSSTIYFPIVRKNRHDNFMVDLLITLNQSIKMKLKVSGLPVA